jgi:hypothetical protein
MKLPFLACVALGLHFLSMPGLAQESRPAEPIRILHVMSYHSPWRWTDGQLDGFKAGLGDVPAEYRVFQLDTKRWSSDEQKAERGKLARDLVAAWKPDLIYTSDDDAQDLVTKHYLNTPIKNVFSGVNKIARALRLRQGEQRHRRDRARALRRVRPVAEEHRALAQAAGGGARRRCHVAAGGRAHAGCRVARRGVHRRLGDDQDLRRVQGARRGLPEHRRWHRPDRHLQLQGCRREERSLSGSLRWTAENSTLPDLGFWIDRVHHGTLAAVTVSEREQGLAAGNSRVPSCATASRPAPFPCFPHPEACR